MHFSIHVLNRVTDFIQLDDSTQLAYVDFLIMKLQHQAHEIRNERPLMKSKLELRALKLLAKIYLVSEFQAIHPEGKSLTPPDFHKWYKLNHERMVELKICAPLSDEELVKQSFGKFQLFSKIDAEAKKKYGFFSIVDEN